MIVCDRKSPLHTLSNHAILDPMVCNIQLSVAENSATKKLLVVWVLGHSKISGNELIDDQAKLGSAARVASQHCHAMWDHCKGLSPAPFTASMAEAGFHLLPENPRELNK